MEDFVARITKLENDREKLLEKVIQQAEWCRNATITIQELKVKQDKISTEIIPDILIKVTNNSSRSGFWGAVGAMIPITVMIVLQLLKILTPG